MFNAEDRTTGRQAADMSLLNQLVLEVYLAAWTMTGVQDEQTLHPVAASSDDVDDGDPELGVIDPDRFFDVTRSVDLDVQGGGIAARRGLSIRTGRAGLPLRLGRMRDSHRHGPRTSVVRNGSRRPPAALRCEHVGSVCYTSGPSLVGQSASFWKGG